MLFGYTKGNNTINVVNNLVLLYVKMFIFKCKTNKTMLSFAGAIKYIFHMF
jgi:hypothetical protein